MSAHERPSSAIRLTSLLDGGEITVLGRMPWSSNFTFLVEVRNGDRTERAVYKPVAGEQPLHDFPPELYKREVAAFELSRALGWPRVPETVVVTDAPNGIGSLQQFRPADFEQHYFTLLEDPETHPQLLEIAVFDVIANNADRKAGHCLYGDDGSIYAIDNGLCFHAEPKLRTVIWEFENEPVPEELLADVERVISAIPTVLVSLLTEVERTALTGRMRAMLKDPDLPPLTSQHQYPWPLI
jgi:uncharacterized repeat protein (TIGR03843 family)